MNENQGLPNNEIVLFVSEAALVVIVVVIIVVIIILIFLPDENQSTGTSCMQTAFSFNTIK